MSEQIKKISIHDKDGVLVPNYHVLLDMIRCQGAVAQLLGVAITENPYLEDAGGSWGSDAWTFGHCHGLRILQHLGLIYGKR